MGKSLAKNNKSVDRNKIGSNAAVLDNVTPMTDQTMQPLTVVTVVMISDQVSSDWELSCQHVNKHPWDLYS